MGKYSIKEVEQLTGVKAHTLRIWEQRYNAVQPHRTKTNIRYYDDEQLKFLINVSLLLKHGRKVSNIFKLSANQMKDELNSLGASGLPGDKFLEVICDSLVLNMMELDEVGFETKLSKAILRYGFEESMQKVIIPFLEKVGILWATNEINVAQEHFISNLIRRKLFVAIDGLSEPSDDAKKFILFLPEGELHEIGLLFCYYAIKRRGYKVIYLGQSVPMSDLSKIENVYQTDYLLSYFTINLENNGVQNSLEYLSTQFPGKEIFVAGPLAMRIPKEASSSIRFFPGSKALLEHMDALGV